MTIPIKSQTKYERLINALPFGIVKNDVSGVISYCNNAFADLTGYSKEELIGRFLWKFAVPELQVALKEQMKKLLDDQSEAGSYSTKLMRKDGGIIDVQVESNCERTGRGNLMGLVSGIIGRTDSARPDKVMLESDNFRDMAEKAVVGVYLVQDAVFKYVNARCANIHGYEIRELIGKKGPWDMIYPEDIPVIKEDLEERVSGSMRSLHRDFRIVTKTKEVRNVEAYGTFTLFQGKPATVGTIIDVTERKRAEEALKRSEEKYRNIFENALEGIFQSTPDGIFISVNPALARMHGFDSPDELVSTVSNVGELYVDAEDRDRVMKLLEKQGTVKAFQTRMYKKDRSIIWVSITSQVLRNDAGAIECHEGVIEDVTERKEIEGRLLESEERYRTAIEHSHDSVTLIKEKKIIYVNQKFLDTFGYDKPEEVIGKSPLIAIHPEDHAMIRRSREQRRLGKAVPVEYEHRGIKKDGTTIFIEVSIASTTYRGKPVTFVYQRDVTDKKMAAEALRQSEERFRALAEKSAELILLIDESGEFTYVSPSIMKMLGYTVNEFISLEKTDYIHPDDIRIWTESKHRIMTHPDETVVFTNRLRHKNGSWRWVESTTRNMLDEPSVRALVLNISDVTERKRAEEDLQQSEKRFRALVEKSSEAVFLNDKDGRRTYVTPSIMRVLGYTVEEFLSMDREGFIHPDDAKKVKAARSYILSNPGETETYINRVCHKDGSWRWVESTVRNLLDEPGVQAFVANIHDVTERVLVEEALRESENKFRDLAEKSFVGVHIIQDGFFRYVNARFAEIHGYAVDEIVNKKVPQDMILGDDLPAVVEKTLRRASGEIKSLHNEFRIITKDGQIKHVEVFGTNTIFKGKPATIGAVIDITERKHAEEALRKSEEKYRNIFENAVEGIFQMNPQGQFLSINPSLAGLFGFESPEDVMMNAADEHRWLFANSEDIQALLQLIETRGSAENFELRYSRKDGRKIWTSVNVRAVRDSNGMTAYYEGSVTDITNRKVAEESLIESEAKYRNVVDHLIVGFYITQDNVFRFVNRRFCEMSGYSFHELVDNGMQPSDLIHAEDKKRVEELMRNRLTGKVEYTGTTFRAIRKDGQIVILKGMSSLLMYDGRPAIAGTVVDITREQTLESQLRQAQKMEAIGTLAGGVAHDFNNILTAIIGYGKLLEMKMGRSDPLKAYVSHILTSSERAANLTRNLLTFSRKQVIELKPADLNKIVAGIARLLKSLLTEDVELKIISSGHEIAIMADVSQIEQILLNLASNANDAMPNGGMLTIETKEIVAEDSAIEGYEHVKPGRYAVIIVRDTGTGIDKDARNKIFEPFFTTKEVGKGTGLGLSIVHGVVEQHHGYITVNTEPGHGTVFSVYIPVIESAADEAEILKTPFKGGTETILVAEDDLLVRGLASEILQSAGYTVIEAHDGVDAVTKFGEHGDTVKLLLLDVVMPKSNGKEAYEKIRKKKPDIKAIFMSGYTGDVIIDKGLGESGYNFIQKPLSPDTLLLRIRELLDT